MPILPVYDAKRNINAIPAAPLENQAAEPWKQAQKATGEVIDVVQKWSDANDVMQYTEAKAKHDLLVADIESRAAADPDFKNSEKYALELQKAREESVKGISNQAVAKKASTEFGYGGQISAIKINAGFQKKQIDYNKIMVADNINSLVQKKINALTPAEMEQYDLEIHDLLSANVAAGNITYAEAEKQLKESQKTAVQYAIYADTSTSEKDSQVLKELKDNSASGKYVYLDPETRLDLIQDSQRRVFQNNQTFKREVEISKNARFDNVFSKMIDNTITLKDIDDELAVPEDQGGIPKKQLLEIKKGIQSKIKTDLEVIVESEPKAKEYLTFIDNFIENDNDRQKGREYLAMAFKDQILSPKEAAFLNGLKRETEDIQWNRETMTNNFIPFKNSITAVGDFFRGRKHSTEQDAAIAIKKMLNGISSGENPDAAVKRVIYEYNIEKNPNIMKISEKGSLHMDSNGIIKWLFPTTEHEEPKSGNK